MTSPNTPQEIDRILGIFESKIVSDVSDALRGRGGARTFGVDDNPKAQAKLSLQALFLRLGDNSVLSTAIHKQVADLSVELQLEIANKVLGMLMTRIYRDETTDFTGFTITKKRVGEHMGKVVDDIKSGALQPIKYAKKLL